MLYKVYRSKAKAPTLTAAKAFKQQHSHQADENYSESEPEFLEYGMYHIIGGHSNLMVAIVKINNFKLHKETDTGASRSIIGLSKCGVKNAS